MEYPTKTVVIAWEGEIQDSIPLCGPKEWPIFTQALGWIASEKELYEMAEAFGLDADIIPIVETESKIQEFAGRVKDMFAGKSKKCRIQTFNYTGDQVEVTLRDSRDIIAWNPDTGKTTPIEISEITPEEISNIHDIGLIVLDKE